MDSFCMLPYFSIWQMIFVALKIIMWLEIGEFDVVDKGDTIKSTRRNVFSVHW